MPCLDTAIRHLHSLEAQMIDRLILSAVLGTVGWHGLHPEPPQPPQPPTARQLMDMARNKSVSNVCAKKKKTKTVKEMCARWEKHQ